MEVCSSNCFLPTASCPLSSRFRPVAARREDLLELLKFRRHRTQFRLRRRGGFDLVEEIGRAGLQARLVGE